MKKSLIFLLLFFVVIVSGCSNKQTDENNLIQNSDNNSAATKPEGDNSILSVASTSSNVNRSISSDILGIKVSYYSDSANEVFAKEQGNKICFWNKFYQGDCLEGQSLELFLKPKETSLSQAIANKFLNSEKFKNNCFVNVIEDTKEYQKAIIDFKNPNTSQNAPCINGDPSLSCDSCPPHYSKTNASLYFIYYKNQPDKYFYFTLGQSSLIGADNGFWYGSSDTKEWFNNVEFIK